MQGTHVRELTPEWVARAVGGRLHPGGGPVRDLVWHSGAATPGSLFAALPGRTTHGRHFIPEALARGASLVLADQAGGTIPSPP